MTTELSPNTQAILLLTAPLIAGRGTASPDLLAPNEYKRLAQHLRELKRQPADLIAVGAEALLQACQPVVDASRLTRLLQRGFLLSQAIERWQTRAIWVISRADAQYPRRLKARLQHDAPAVLYGCGDPTWLDHGGLAVVGSRGADEALTDYARAMGTLGAQAGRAIIVNGGARNVGQPAMHGALDSGGHAVGVLTDGLEQAATRREHRQALLAHRLVLVSPFDPAERINAGEASQRHALTDTLVYALADAALMVDADEGEGASWAAATAQLQAHRFVPVHVRASGPPSAGLDALRRMGASDWPAPETVDAFEAVFGDRRPGG